MAVILGEVLANRDKYVVAVGGDLRMVGSARELHTDLDQHPQEDLVIIGPDVDISAAADTAIRYRASRPSLGMVLVRRRLEVSTLNQALRSGIREVVGIDDTTELLGACNRSIALSRELRSHSDVSLPATKGHIVIVFSAKGGCGKTTISSNLAAAIRERTGQTVALVDFDLQFGDIGVALQLEPTRSIADAIGMHANLDAQGVQSMLIEYRPGLDVLLAPLHPSDVEHISADMAQQVLTHLQYSHDWVVVDSPPAFTEVVLRTFDMADEFVLLTTLDMPAIKNLKVTMDTLDALAMPRDKWHVLVNRSDARMGLSVEDVEKAIGLSVNNKIASSNDVPMSINSGEILFLSKPKHVVSREIAQLATDVTEKYSKAAGNEKPGLLARVRGAR